MNVEQKAQQVSELRTKFVDFLKSKPAPTSADLEEAEKQEKELKTAEDELSRESALKARQDEIEQKLAAEREAQKAGIQRPSFTNNQSDTMKKSEGDGVEYDEPVNVNAPNALARLFFNSPGYKALAREGGWPSKDQRVETKGVRRVKLGLEEKAAGDPIQASQFTAIRTDLSLDPHLIAAPSVYDMVPKVAAGASSIRYLVPTDLTPNPAAAVAEGALKPEAQPRWAPRDAPLETIAVWTAVTVQALADIPGLRQVIDSDLRALVVDRTDDEMINGSGVPPHLLGFLNTPGIGTASGDFLTGTLTGITQMQTSRAGTPTVLILNPADWQAIRLLNTSGVYWWGPPTEAGIMRMWGVPVVSSVHIAAGTGLLADMRFVTFFQSMDITFIVGWKNDDIIKNLQTIVCELRGALVVRRPKAVVKLTITAPAPTGG